MTRSAPRRPRRELPLWLLAIGLLGVLALWVLATDQGYARIFRALAGGVATTLWVALVAFFLACVLGLLVAVARTSRFYLLRQLAIFYTELVRGIPILVCLFYVAFVGAPWAVDVVNWGVARRAEGRGMTPLRTRAFEFAWRAIFAASICYSAIIADVGRAGIEAVGRGPLEGARSLGLWPWLTFRLVVAPQARRI